MIEIRTARGGDASALSGLLGELGFPAVSDEVAARLDGLARHGETVLVCCRGDVVLGFVSVHVTRVLHRPQPVGRLTALVVTSSARGQGIGRDLVGAAERHLQAAGCALVEVTSNHRLTHAHTFYQHLGYEATSYRFAKSLL